MKKIAIKDNVTPKTIIGLWGFTLSYFLTNGLLGWDWKSEWTWFLVSFTIACFFVVLGVDKPGMISNVIKILGVLQNEKLSTDQRLAMIREIVNQILGLYIDFTVLDNMEKEEKIEPLE